jgi:hypothetical protein
LVIIAPGVGVKERKRSFRSLQGDAAVLGLKDGGFKCDDKSLGGFFLDRRIVQKSGKRGVCLVVMGFGCP